ncbi:glucose dehydrogenase [FAD, quinone]-like isoform X1 [Vanessa cardui]|uniref:glucose dehydrogenase [FAD, quinone]-like isoform X1 n=1 Tax=Vanessa cardui TaxID=171605 RepID=UPI001F1477B7|nr:glucose dehydrogenase [FAD, quinone]-like isoform X1 [Vanessa cardui]
MEGIILVLSVILFLSNKETVTAYREDFYNEGIVSDEYAQPVACEEYCNHEYKKIQKREDKFSTPIRSRIVETMLKAPMFAFNRSEPNIFSAFRDNYDLPLEFKGPLKEYDFIVVGAGSAGSVLASRLSEGRKASVLLLEAGQGEAYLTGVPILAPLLQQTTYMWPYLMEHQPGVCMGMVNERCFWPRGKAVGGSSVVNYMIYTRGNKKDWDRIAAKGNYGWSYDNVTAYYIKSERANLREFRDSPWHGRNGELTVEDIPFRSKLSKAFLDAAKFLGNRRVDYNSADSFGFNHIQATISRGLRMSSAKAFLHTKKKRKNLHILTNSQVIRVLIDPQSKTATGVEFMRNGQRYKIRATKEVILSAGPIESPHLLMLSGIGPKEHLESMGIPVIQNLKVGESLYDHITFPSIVFTLNSTRLTLVERKIANIENMVQYTQFGDGPFSSLAGIETIGYIKTNVSDEKEDFPDLELFEGCASFSSDEGSAVARGIHMADWLYKDVYKPIEDVESFTVLFMLLHPKSKGYLRLRSKNPFEYPKLYGNYLTHPKDVATMIAGIRYVIRMVNTPPFQKYGATLYTKKFPNCKQFDFGTDSYWECAIRTVTMTLHHQISTCKMGPAWDPEAVVDPELRVYGIKKLRVADSSIIPNTIAAHTNAPAIMIGEKCADMIKNTWALN